MEHFVVRWRSRVKRGWGIKNSAKFFQLFWAVEDEKLNKFAEVRVRSYITHLFLSKDRLFTVVAKMINREFYMWCNSIGETSDFGNDFETKSFANWGLKRETSEKKTKLQSNKENWGKNAQWLIIVSCIYLPNDLLVILLPLLLLVK